MMIESDLLARREVGGNSVSFDVADLVLCMLVVCFPLDLSILEYMES